MESNITFNPIEAAKIQRQSLERILVPKQLGQQTNRRVFKEPIGHDKKGKIVYGNVTHQITTYQDVARVSLTATIVHVKSDADIDHDGSKHAYTDNNQPINGIQPKDKIANLSNSNRDGYFPECDPAGRCFVKSTTTFQDANDQYIDAESVPYIALPTIMYNNNNPWGVRQGDLVYMYNATTGIGIYGIVADGSGLKMGEISDCADRVLQPNDGDLHYFVMPRTLDTTRNPDNLTYDAIQRRGKAVFDPVNNVRDAVIKNKALSQ